MQITALDPTNQPAALAYLRSSPYRNALPLSNVTQLRPVCDVVVAHEDGQVLGVASTYHELPVANLTFAADTSATTGALLAALADRNPRLHGEEVWALLPLDRTRLLAPYVHMQSSEIEYQMVVEPEVLRMPAGHQPRRLGAADIPQMDALADAAGLGVWHASSLALGPAFGCFADGTLVAMAATHFATAEVVEIGHVATHPEHRRRGYAAACTAALTRAAFTLAPRVFLMVLEYNTPALAVYSRLGFRTMERMSLNRFTI